MQRTAEPSALLIAVRVVKQENSRAISATSTNKSMQVQENIRTLLKDIFFNNIKQ